MPATACQYAPIRRTWFQPIVALWMAGGAILAGHTFAQGPLDGFEFFEKRVRPVLVERCFECHSEDHAESSLRLDSLAGILQGGERGPAVVPGKPDESLLVSAIRHGEILKMPAREKLPTEQIADLAHWIEIGSPWPDANVTPTAVTPAHEEAPLTDEERGFWSLQPIVRPNHPAVRRRDWVRGPIDAFILRDLEANQLHPATPADKRTLIRRATLDLLGLPPTRDEIDAFINDPSPAAFATAVDRLLGSPRYGERWGRHWLDIARYADSNGLDENLAQANAFHYRDYVIAAINKDKPFDRFVQEQIAGDLVASSSVGSPASEPLEPSARDDWDSPYEGQVATGFLSLGAKMLAEDDPVKMQMDIIDEQIDTVGRAFLGITLGCARCHDHKFDPIRLADYYGLAGILKSTKTMENFNVVARWREVPLASTEQVAERDRCQTQLDETRKKIDELVATETAKVQQQAQAAGQRLEAAEIEQHFAPDAQRELSDLRDQLKRFEATLPQLPAAMAVGDDAPTDVAIHVRGSHLTLGRVIPRRLPAILSHALEIEIAPDRGGRWELARWITDARNPLTARVIVNRVWHWHFGEGLVRSPDNFGRLGERPTHPELLNWLAHSLIESGWSIKQLHRTIMLSATYQMSTEWNSHAAQRDPENKLWWRFNRRRLDAEIIRDAMLATSGSLDLRMGGSILPTENRKYVTNTSSIDPVVYDCRRRSVYLPVVRSALFDMFQAFDFAEPSTLNGYRQSTTVAPQALFMMNSKFAAEQARTMASRLLHGGTDGTLVTGHVRLAPGSEPARSASADSSDWSVDERERVVLAFSVAYGRDPEEYEIVRALRYLTRYAALPENQSLGTDESRLRAWQSLCRALMAANEFVYVE